MLNSVVPEPVEGPVRNILHRIDKGLRIVLKPFQIVSNFILFTVAYFLGVGLSSIFYRLGNKSKTIPPDSYWLDVPPAPKDRDSWLRPF